MAERRVTVRVDLLAGGNLPQVAGAAAAQVAKVQAATKGAAAAAANAGYGGFGSYLPKAAQPAAWAQWTSAASPNAQVLKRGIPIAQFAPATARLWTQQDTLHTEGQKRLTDAEQRLTYLRSGPGQAATLRALQAETALARQQEYLAQVAQRGRMGAALEHLQPALRTAGMIGGAGLAAGYAGIASVSPEASSHVTNSFRMIANEIGIAAIPSAVRFTGALQSLSRAVRTANEGTHGWAGTVAFTGAGLATAAGAVSTIMNVGRGITDNAGRFARWSGLAAQVAAPAAGQAAARAAGSTAGATAAQVGGGAAGGTFATAAAAPGGITVGGMAAVAIAAVSAELGRANIVGNIIRDRGGFAADAQRSPIQYGLDIARFMVAPAAFLPTQLAMTAYRAAPADVSEREPRFYETPLDLERAMTARIQQQPGPIAEQETRAMSEWLQAIHGQLERLNGTTAQGQNWGPPAQDNG